MRYFLDTEFVEDDRTIDLISVQSLEKWKDYREWEARHRTAGGYC